MPSKQNTERNENMKALRLITQLTIFAAIVLLLRENKRIRDQLTELTQKYWEGNMQIALYSDEVNKLRKKAKWEPMKDQKGNEHYYICSVCGAWHPVRTNFCPRCGRIVENCNE